MQHDQVVIAQAARTGSGRDGSARPSRRVLRASRHLQETVQSLYRVGLGDKFGHDRAIGAF